VKQCKGRNWKKQKIKGERLQNGAVWCAQVSGEKGRVRAGESEREREVERDREERDKKDNERETGERER
jgi:hypothetical protein